jgi:hypothetical protein
MSTLLAQLQARTGDDLALGRAHGIAIDSLGGDALAFASFQPLIDPHYERVSRSTRIPGPLPEVLRFLGGVAAGRGSFVGV